MSQPKKYAVEVKETLDVDDLMRAAEIAGALSESLDLEELKAAKEGRVSKERVGRKLLLRVMEVVPQEGKRFMAGACGMTVEEFGQQPAGAFLDVFEQLRDREDIRDFLSRAADFAKSFGLTGDGESEKSNGPAGDTGTDPQK